MIKKAISGLVRLNQTDSSNQVNKDRSMIGDGVFIGQAMLERGFTGVLNAWTPTFDAFSRMCASSLRGTTKATPFRPLGCMSSVKNGES